jgi:hypothetical protein
MTVLCQKRTYLADLVPLPSEGVSFPPDAACMSGAPPVAWGAFSLENCQSVMWSGTQAFHGPRLTRIARAPRETDGHNS